jgi:uncharacterized protein YjbI with pentapeptide repeats
LADAVHIEVLRHGPKAWNAWRDQRPLEIPDLDDATLSLGERQWGTINGGPINLRSAQIRRAYLRSADLSGADLEAADLSETELSFARLPRANLVGANLSHAVLDHADLGGANLARANLKGATLRYVENLTQAQINESICDLTTIFPEFLVHPISTLGVVREGDSLASHFPDLESQFRSVYITSIKTTRMV